MQALRGGECVADDDQIKGLSRNQRLDFADPIGALHLKKGSQNQLAGIQEHGIAADYQNSRIHLDGPSAQKGRAAILNRPKAYTHGRAISVLYRTNLGKLLVSQKESRGYV